MDKTHFCARLEAEQQELRMLSEAGRESRAPVVLDQQSVGCLSRMDAMQQTGVIAKFWWPAGLCLLCGYFITG